MATNPINSSWTNTFIEEQPSRPPRRGEMSLFLNTTFPPSGYTPRGDEAFRKLNQDTFDPSGISPRHAPIPEPIASRAGQLLEDAQARLGLSKSALARICSVTRQTIYDWINGAHEPTTEHTPRLELLDTLLSSHHLRGLQLSQAWLKRKTIRGVSLLEVLERAEVDRTLALDVLGELVALYHRLEHPTQTGRERLNLAPLDEAQRARNLAHNLPLSSGE